MSTPFDSLPIELQTSVLELRAAQTPEPLIDDLIARAIHALGVKSNRVQVEVWEMQDRLLKQQAQIGDKLQIDLQTQFGSTNGMLVDLRGDLQEALAGIADVKKNWEELADWRNRVEAALMGFAESRDESKTERADIQQAIRDMDARHGGQIAQLIMRMGGSEADRATLHELIAELFTRLNAIEQLLEVAGEHDRREAGG